MEEERSSCRSDRETAAHGAFLRLFAFGAQRGPEHAGAANAGERGGRVGQERHGGTARGIHFVGDPVAGREGRLFERMQDPGEGLAQGSVAERSALRGGIDGVGHCIRPSRRVSSSRSSPRAPAGEVSEVAPIMRTSCAANARRMVTMVFETWLGAVSFHRSMSDS